MRLDELKQPLKEGGNAVKSSVRINQENVDATMKSIAEILLPKLNICREDTRNLGSTGKKAPGDSSGDVDLAISVKSLMDNNNLEEPKDIYDFIVSVANSTSKEVNDLRQIGLISLAWPIANVDRKQAGESVQLDLMIVDSIEWAEWAYHSPAHDESTWKGLYRNEIFYALAKHMNYEMVSRAPDRDGEEVDVEWKRDFFDLGKGLLTGTQSRMGKRGKAVKSVTTLNKETRSTCPAEVVALMFGPDVEPSSLLTWEDTFRMLMDPNFVHSDKRNDILQMTKDGILKKGFPVPGELEEATNK